MRPSGIVYLLVALFGVFLCASQSTNAGDWGKVSEAEWKLTPPPDYPEANAAVVFDRCTLTVSTDQIEIIRHVRMKVFRKAGAQEIGNSSFLYRDGDKITELKAHTITPDGRQIDVNGKDIFTKTVGDWREKTFAFASVDSGCILEYRYRNVNKDYAFLQPWYFQGDVYTFQSQFALLLYPGFNYSASYSNIPAQDREPVVGETNAWADFSTKVMSFTWTRKMVLPVTDEPLMGARQDYYSALRYQLVSYKDENTFIPFLRTWPELGKNREDVYADYLRGGNVDGIVAEATAGATTPEERVQKLYEYVAAKVKTKEDDFGMYFTHEHLAGVLKDGFGTAEEKNMLLVELCRKAGVQAWPVLICTRDHRRFNPEIVQLQQFNSLIAYAQFDSGFVFMDAQTKYCPFGMLPPNSLVDAGFLVDGKNSQVVKVQSTQPKSYRLDVTHIMVDSAGMARCSSVCNLSGYLAPEYGILSEEKAPEDFLKEYFLSRVSDQAELESHDISIDSTGRFVVTFVYTLKDFVRELDNNLMLRPISYRFKENPFKRERRFYPIDFDYPFTYHSMTFVESARPIASATMPASVDLAITGMTFKRRAMFLDGIAQVDARMTIGEAIYAPLNYRDIRSFFDGVAQASQDDILLQLGGQQ